MFFIFAMSALAIDLSAGHLAELPFGYCALWGTGVYTLAILTSRLGWSFWVACPLAGCMVSVITLLMGIPLVRVKGAYFAFLTLGFALAMRLIVKNWNSLTGGVYGISGLPGPRLSLPFFPAVSFVSEFAYSYLAMAGLLLTIFIYHRLTTSPFGRAITAIRENETLASSAGIYPLEYKLVTLVITGFLAGINGALYAGYMRLAVPSAYDLWYSILPLVIMLVGGERHIGGALTGAFFLVYIPEYLRLAA
jgi:branched-chain amino acid transport system permease protein